MSDESKSLSCTAFSNTSADWSQLDDISSAGVTAGPGPAARTSDGWVRGRFRAAGFRVVVAAFFLATAFEAGLAAAFFTTFFATFFAGRAVFDFVFAATLRLAAAADFVVLAA